jgi:large subunit ribosomal protein L7A
MDTQNYSKIPKCGSLPDLSAFKVVVGSKQLRKALVNGRARYVFLAENADPCITEPMEALCIQNHVAYHWVPTMSELGNACGIEVGAAAAAAVD